MNEMNQGAMPAYPEPCVEVVGVRIPHNTAKWRVATNRHPNIDCSDWGWIEGAPGNVCWSDNERFNRDAAGEAVRCHNQWLEDQKPLSIKLIETRERWVVAKQAADEARERSDKAEAAWLVVDQQMQSLLAALSDQPTRQEE